MKLVIDASVAVKWFVQEDGHDDALAILVRNDECFAPDLLLVEIAGAFDKKIKAGAFLRSQAVDALRSVQSNMTMVAGARLIESALIFASDLNHPVADCVYMACAVELGATLVTADDIFLTKAANRGYRNLVVALGRETQKRLSAEYLSEAEIAAIEKLAGEVRDVFDFVRANTGQPFGDSGLRLHDSGDLAPAFSSPNYARLVRHIDSLEASKRHELIALCWLGRGFDGENWSALVEHARSVDPRNKADTGYIISKLNSLSKGVDRLKELAQTAAKS